MKDLLDRSASYDPTYRYVTKETSLENVKNLIENLNLLDASLLPAQLPIFSIFLTFLQKAIAAKEAAQAYYRDVNDGAELEVLTKST